MPNGLLEQPAAPIPQGQPPAPQGQPPAPQGQPPMQQPQPGQAAPAPAQPEQAAPAPMRNYQQNPLGKQDEDALEMFVVSAQKLIHSEQSRDSIINRIGISSRGVIDDISDTVLVLIDKIDEQSVKDNGQKVDDAVKIQGANAVTGEVIEIAETAGKISKLSDDEKAVAFSHAVQKYTNRMLERGEITKEDLTIYAQQAKKIAEEKGEIDVEKVNKAQVAATAPAPAAGSTPGSAPPIGGGAKPMSEVLAERGGLLNG